MLNRNLLHGKGDTLILLIGVGLNLLSFRVKFGAVGRDGLFTVANIDWYGLR